ncbi:hypothetical protein [Streptomyces sp. f150]|uniref:hypothetical protein n=1 Tax=Streptomyces sp. f150 TaxID=1827699 RepID=UPI000D1CCA49|nr:hypothetical protein [Streptomyces sp. f150]
MTSRPTCRVGSGRRDFRRHRSRRSPGPVSGSRENRGGRLAVVAIVVALVAVVASGRDGGRSVPPDDTSSTHNHD